MSAGIETFDRGFLLGEQPWHKDPRFIVQDAPVTIEQMIDVFNWEIEKKPLFYVAPDGSSQEVAAFSLIRKDTGHILVDSVGKKFVAESNLKLVEIIRDGVLKAYPDLICEGAFTIFNNRTAVIQLKAKEFQVKGDKSPSFTRMCFANPIGMGAYKALVHNERVVCANTLRVAESEGRANKSLRKFSHLNSAFNKINIYMEEMAAQWLLLDKHIETLNLLASQPITSEEIDKFLKCIYPQNSTMSDIAVKHNMEKRTAILNQFNTDQDLRPDIAFSKYGLLQALTYVIDHEQLRKDAVKTHWENIAGVRMDLKAAGYNHLIAA